MKSIAMSVTVGLALLVPAQAPEEHYSYGESASVTVSSYDGAGEPVTMTATVTVEEPRQGTEDFGNGEQDVLYFPLTVRAQTDFEPYTLEFSYTAPDGLTTRGSAGLYGTLYPEQTAQDEVTVYRDDGGPTEPGGYLQVEGLLDDGRFIWG